MPPCRAARMKVLAGVWLGFLVLVLAGVHGSSLGALAEQLEPGENRHEFLLTNARKYLANVVRDGPRLRSACQTEARPGRSDEFLLWTPYALSQLRHQPPFPVVNDLLPGGQNMLLVWNAPVAHVSLPARPATWGYFLFGAARGLAWQWWFPPFACFTVLWLLFDVILRGDSRLAAFGAVWFCTSAHTVAWSLMPAYDAFFAALACLSAYHVLSTARRAVLWANAALLALGLAGFVMVLYPPWQIVLTYVFGLVFVGLVLRDRPWQVRTIPWWHRTIATVAAVLVAGGLLAAWAVDARDGLRAMAGSVYPGNRISLGGHLRVGRLFAGWFNLVSLYGPNVQPDPWFNPSEAASFYHFYPAVVLGLLFVPRVRRAVGVVTWLLLPLAAALIVYCLVGVPEWLARATLMARCPEFRCDLAVGLVSIVVCLDVLCGLRAGAAVCRWDRVAPAAGGVVMAAVGVLAGIVARADVGRLLPIDFLIPTAVAIGAASYALLAGRRRLFAGIVGSAVLATGLFYNPLARGLAALDNLDLTRAVDRLNRASPDGPPFWVCYGSRGSGVVVGALGGRSLTTVPFHPVTCWHDLDPDGSHAGLYNRHAHFRFFGGWPGSDAEFSQPAAMVVEILVPWDHPAFLRRGVRYVLVEGDEAAAAAPVWDDPRLRLVYRSPRHGHAIYEVVTTAAADPPTAGAE